MTEKTVRLLRALETGLIKRIPQNPEQEECLLNGWAIEVTGTIRKSGGTLFSMTHRQKHRVKALQITKAGRRQLRAPI